MLLMGLIGLALIVFLVANRQPMTISLDPLPADDPSFFIDPMPQWVGFAIFLFVGYFLGAFGMWLSGKGLRRRAADRKQEIRRLRKEVETVSTPKPEGATNLPAIRR